MNELSDYAMRALAVGTGATAFMDVVVTVRTRIFKTPSPDYGLVGRWLGHLGRGRFHHRSITESPSIRGERLVGWTAHYATGIAFAAALLGIWGVGWTCHPTLTPALIVGIGSVLAPFMILQPGMGAGIAASRTPRPSISRLRSIVTHAIFGMGLYVSGWLATFLDVFDCAHVAL